MCIHLCRNDKCIAPKIILIITKTRIAPFDIKDKLLLLNSKVLNSVPETVLDWPWERNIPVPVCAGAPFWGYALDAYIL